MGLEEGYFLIARKNIHFFLLIHHVLSFISDLLHKLFGLINKSFITCILYNYSMFVCWLVVMILSLIIIAIIIIILVIINNAISIITINTNYY